MWDLRGNQVTAGWAGVYVLWFFPGRTRTLVRRRVVWSLVGVGRVSAAFNFPLFLSVSAWWRNIPK